MAPAPERLTVLVEVAFCMQFSSGWCLFPLQALSPSNPSNRLPPTHAAIAPNCCQPDFRLSGLYREERGSMYFAFLYFQTLLDGFRCLETL